MKIKIFSCTFFIMTMFSSLFASNTISIPSRLVRSGDTVQVKIVMTNDVPINGLNMFLQFDTAYIKPLSIMPLGPAALLSGSTSYLSEGKISFIVYDAHGNNLIPMSDSIFQITFLATNTQYGIVQTHFTFVAATIADTSNAIVDVNFIDGVVTITDVDNSHIGKHVPTTYALYQNYPNPFNPRSIIRFDFPAAAIATLRIYSILGQEVRTFFDKKEFQPGQYQESIDGSLLSSGVYFYRIEATSVSGPKRTFSSVKKMMLIK